MIRCLLLVAAAFLLAGAALPPEKPVELRPEEAAAEGKALVAELLSLRPERSSTNTGTLFIRKPKGKGSQRIPVRFVTTVTATNWKVAYWATIRDNQDGRAVAGLSHVFVVRRAEGETNQYGWGEVSDVAGLEDISGGKLMTPFAGSDFWLADLALEFFHWPTQRLVRKEMARSRSCRVLESVHPNPPPGGYSKVISWIDRESSGIVQAEAYDAKGKLLKQFFPKSFKKVEGQWQLQEMQINNVQTGSRTTIEFELE